MAIIIAIMCVMANIGWILIMLLKIKERNQPKAASLKAGVVIIIPAIAILLSTWLIITQATL